MLFHYQHPFGSYIGYPNCLSLHFSKIVVKFLFFVLAFHSFSKGFSFLISIEGTNIYNWLEFPFVFLCLWDLKCFFFSFCFWWVELDPKFMSSPFSTTSLFSCWINWSCLAKVFESVVLETWTLWWFMMIF